MYFDPLATVKETRIQYHYLAEKYHQDSETTQIINASYHAALEKLDSPEYHYDRAAERALIVIDEIAANMERSET